MRKFADFTLEAYAQFLSIQAQDFIEECRLPPMPRQLLSFLSIQAQDFIEECRNVTHDVTVRTFLSIQAQDFIEEILMKHYQL